MHRLFVYGTLMSGDVRSCYLRGQSFLSQARTLPKYRMLNVGGYPGLILDERQGRAIEGELYEVDSSTLAILDEVEGVADGLYRRKTVELEIPAMASQVETYFYARETTGLADCGCRWNREWST